MNDLKIENEKIIRNLKRQGWKDLEFYIDLDYLNKVGFPIIAQETIDAIGYIVHEATNTTRGTLTNILCLFGSTTQNYLKSYLSVLTPNSLIPSLINKNTKYSLKVKETESNYYIAVKVLEKLGTPQKIYQEVNEKSYKSDNRQLLELDPKYFTRWENLEIVSRLYLFFSNDIQVEIWDEEIGFRGEYTKSKRIDIYFPSKEVRSEVINESLRETAFLQTNKSIKVGKPNSKYTLKSFTKEVLTFGKEIENKIKKIDNSTNAEKLAIMIQGTTGVGKTSFVNAFIKEVVAPLNYLIINMDLESLSEYSPLPYVDKICIVINDGDNLALSREERTDGFTEKVMSLLDGNYLNCINSDDNSNIKLLIFITANTVERWDTAALRKGRIDLSYAINEPIFNQNIETRIAC